MINSSDLKRKTVKGLGWSAVDSIASQGVSFLVGLILARLLSPNEFGTIGIAMIFVAVFNKIVDCGFSNALVRKHSIKNIDCNTTFIFNFCVSVILYIVCFISAPYIAIYFDNELLVGVVRVISIVLIINAFAIIQKTHLVRNIDFKTQAKISVISSLLSGVIGIALAFYGYGVWSLVAQQLSRQFCNTVLLWIYIRWIPKLEFSFSSFHELFSYGGKLMLSGIIDTILNDIITIFIGKIYTPSTLGQYSRAKQFSGMFSSNVSTVVDRVTYPVLSKIRNDKDSLIAKYRIIIKALMLIVGLGCAVIASCAESIILILIGPQWIESILYLRLLAFVEVTIPLKNFNLILLQVYGRSDYILRLSIIKRLIEFVVVFLGFINLKWMLIGFAVAGFIGLLLNAYYIMRVSGYTVKQQILDLFPSFILSTIVGSVMYVFTLLFDNIYLGLLLSLLIGAFVFFLISECVNLKEYKFIKGLAKEYIVKLIKRK